MEAPETERGVAASRALVTSLTVVLLAAAPTSGTVWLVARVVTGSVFNGAEVDGCPSALLEDCTIASNGNTVATPVSASLEARSWGAVKAACR